jgi:iron complex transport system substrate-binding protein
MEDSSESRRQIGAGARLRKGALGAAAGCAIATALIFISTSESVAAAPQRIVSTNLCADEYVFRLVDRRHIAALSFEAGDRHPVVSTIADEVGGIAQIRPSAETVLSLHPDLVVMFAGTLPRLRAALDELQVPVLELPYADSLAAIRATTRMLGQALGAPERAQALLARMDAQLAAARRVAAGQSVRTLIYEPNGYATTGPVTEELMAAAGLRDAAPVYALTRLGRIPVEEVIAAAPQLLVFSGQQAVIDARANLVLHHPALAALDGRTYMTWNPLLPLLCAGPWSADAAPLLAALGAKARALAPVGAHP